MLLMLVVTLVLFVENVVDLKQLLFSMHISLQRKNLMRCHSAREKRDAYAHVWYLFSYCRFFLLVVVAVNESIRYYTFLFLYFFYLENIIYIYLHIHS